MTIINRVRGDTYPVEATLKINGLPVNLTGAIVNFSYKKVGDPQIKTILGVHDNSTNGIVVFTPTADDFTIAGTYDFDIERYQDGIKITHIIGRLVLADDITKI